MRILIHAVNSSLYTDADPDSVTWTGPPPEIVTTQSLLYASLTTSLFAAFIAMLGKQWLTWYLRNRGGSAAEKSRDRQRKLDGLESWYFHIVIESLPVMLQLALLLLGCALSRYLWSISRTVARVAVAATVLGAIAYICFTLAATLFYNCPYQTPASLIIRFLVSHHHTTRTSPPAPPVPTSRRPMEELGRFLRRLRSGMRSAVSGSGCVANTPHGTPDIPLANVTSPVRIFPDTSLDWESLKADLSCVSWVLYSTTDSDMTFSTVRFAADLTWYPEIAGTLSPHALTDLFFECLLDRRVIPGRTEHANLIGMALASTLGIQLIVEPESEDLNQLCRRIAHNIDLSSSSEAVFGLVVSVLDFVAQTPFEMVDEGSLGIRINDPPKYLPITSKLWLGRMILQTVWRWRCLQHHTLTIDFYWIASICKNLVAEGDQVPAIFKTIWILTLTICLGATVDIHDLYPPNNEYVAFPFWKWSIFSLIESDALFTALDFLHGQLTAIIRAGNVRSSFISSAFSTLSDLDIPQVANFQEVCISWIHEIVSSTYPEDERYSMACSAVALLGKWFDSPQSTTSSPHARTTAIRPLLYFLRLSERFFLTGSPPYPEVIALQAILTTAEDEYFDPAILPVLASVLPPAHPLQSRTLALRLFQQPGFEWCSSRAEIFSDVDRARLLDAVGDPFQFIPDPPPQDEQSTTRASYDPMRTTILLIEFASSNIWRNHLRHSNFASCEEMIPTEEAKGHAFRCMIKRGVGVRTGPLNSVGKLVLAIRRLEELECWNTADTVILWACTNHDMSTHGLIGQETLDHYHPRGIERRRALSKYIQAGVRQPARIHVVGGVSSQISRKDIDFSKISRTCQLRRLYQLFGCDPTTWEEAVGGGKVNEVSLGSGSGRKVEAMIPAHALDTACDYP